MEQVGRRRADAGLLVALARIERAPLGAVVDGVLVDDETTRLTDGLAVVGVVGERAAALGANGLFRGLSRVACRFLAVVRVGADS